MCASSRWASRSESAASPDSRHDLLGDLGHLLAGLEEPLGVAPVDVAPVEGDQPAGGVEDVDGGGVAAVGVADRVGQHRAEPRLPGHPGHPGGVGGGAGTPALGAAAGQPVGDQLDLEVGAGHQLAPRREGGQGEVVAAPGRGPGRLGGRAEQHDQVAGRQLLAELLGEDGEVDDRLAALPGEVGGRDQPAQRRPAGPAPAEPMDGGAVGTGQEGHPRQPADDRVAVAAAAHRGPGGRGWLPAHGWVGWWARSTPSTGRIPAE